MFGRAPPPRRALLAATAGALYSFLILPDPNGAIGITLFGVVWFLLAASLLTLHPIAYHVYVFWGILWIPYRSILFFKGDHGSVGILLADLILPIASVALLMTSTYLSAAARRLS